MLATIPLDEFIFTRAGLWADEIRFSRHPDHAENKPAWHYINYPLRPANYELAAPIGGDLHQAISNCLVALKNPGEVPAQKAIALAWLIHLIADLHQPLHNTSLVIPRLPDNGDRGGNDFFIKPPQQQVTRATPDQSGPSPAAAAGEIRWQMRAAGPYEPFPKNGKSPQLWTFPIFGIRLSLTQPKAA